MTLSGACRYNPQHVKQEPRPQGTERGHNKIKRKPYI